MGQMNNNAHAQRNPNSGGISYQIRYVKNDNYGTGWQAPNVGGDFTWNQPLRTKRSAPLHQSTLPASSQNNNETEIQANNIGGNQNVVPGIGTQVYSNGHAKRNPNASGTIISIGYLKSENHGLGSQASNVGGTFNWNQSRRTKRSPPLHQTNLPASSQNNNVNGIQANNIGGNQNVVPGIGTQVSSNGHAKRNPNARGTIINIGSVQSENHGSGSQASNVGGTFNWVQSRRTKRSPPLHQTNLPASLQNNNENGIQNNNIGGSQNNLFGTTGQVTSNGQYQPNPTAELIPQNMIVDKTSNNIGYMQNSNHGSGAQANNVAGSMTNYFPGFPASSFLIEVV